ncbi:MAG TPA: FG-GAP-like repeat-containing protein, partial [Chitinophaga sp.]
AGNGVAAPVKVTLADFDLDGKNDLVVVNAATRSVSVWHNTGSGNNTSFSRSDYVTGEDVSNVSVTDLDGDGRLDIAIGRGTWPVDAPSVYRNTSTPGNVSFEATAGRYGLNVLAADVDLDGKPDLISTNGVYRNTSSAGNISFAAVAPHNVGGSTVVVKDLDLDGKPDIISLHVSDNMLTIGRNTSTVGHISFAASAALGVTRPYDVTAGDLDGDNKPDIAVASDDYGTLSVFRNTSTTGTIAFAARADIQTGYVSLDIAMHDLDGDGKADVVLTHPFEDEFSVYKNTSNIGSVSFASAVYYSIDGYPGGLAAGNVTGDGKPDIVIVNGVVSGISVYNNRVSPAPFISSFTPATGAAGTIVTINGHNFNGITGVSFGGVNAASFTVNSPVSITAVVGTGAAGSVAVTNVYGTATKAGFAYGLPPVISSISPASAVAGASVTISGAHFSTSAQSNIVTFGGVRANVLSASANSLVVTVPPGSVYRPVSVTVNSLSAYTEQPFITTFPGADSAFTAASFGAKAEFEGRGMGSIADVDGDGKLDMVFPSGDKVIAVSRNTSKPGSLSFASKIVFPGPDEFYELAPADMDGDGKQDIIVSTEGAQLSILRNISTGGNPAFAPKVDFKVDGAMGFATGDLDQDGKPDLVVVNYAGAISLFRNISRNGVIAIDRRVNYTMPSPRAVALGDFDNDGRPDIVVAMNSSIAVYRNTSTVGAISFTPVWNMPVTSPTRLYTPDIDGDGKTDIVVNLRFTKEVIVFRNSSASANISFAAKQSFAIGDDAYYITIADLDGDNKPDIVANNRDNNTISILKNTATPGTIAMLAKTDYAVPDGLNTSTNGDMDGDGKPDLITFHGTNQLFIWRNQMDRSVLFSYCAGSDTSLTAAISGSTYKWQQNTGGGFVDVTNNVHLSGANTATLHLSDIPADWNGYQYRCIVNGKTDNISLLHLESEALPVAGITASERTICAGTPVTFTATADNAGTAPAWQWLINGKAITGADNNVFTSDTLRNGAMVSAVVSSNTFCKRGIKDTSNIITMEVTAPVVFTGKATAPARSYIDNPFLITFKGNNVPAGAIVEVWESIDSSPFAEIGDYYYKGDTLYRWMRDNPSVGVKRYFFHMKPVTDTNCFRAANSDTVTVVIAAPGPPTIVEVCTGADTTLTSSRTGTSYKWQIRSVGSPFYDVSDDNIFSGGKTAVLHVSNIPAVWDNYQFRCIVDGVSSDTFALKVLPDVSPAITIAVAANPVCAGSQVTFTTAVVNAGASPEYKWQLNGLPAGPDSNTYTTDDLADGDKVSAIITSHERCVIAPADTSNTIVMSVERLDKPAVAQSNLALSITNFDITVAYRWQQLDSATVWVDVVPAETDTSYLALKKGSYRVRATKGICTAYSDQLTVLITGLEPVVNNTSGIHLYPNPVVNSLTLDALKLSDKWETLDILGIGASQSLATYNISGRTKVTINVSRLNYGYYIAVLKRKNGPPAAIRFIKM